MLRMMKKISLKINKCKINFRNLKKNHNGNRFTRAKCCYVYAKDKRVFGHPTIKLNEKTNNIKLIAFCTII